MKDIKKRRDRKKDNEKDIKKIEQVNTKRKRIERNGERVINDKGNDIGVYK